jgi:hypothetical protein
MIKSRFEDGVHAVGETVVTLTAGGLTTWVEMFKHSKEKDVGPARILQPLIIVGDTAEVLSWAEKMVSDIKLRATLKGQLEENND